MFWPTVSLHKNYAKMPVFPTWNPPNIEKFHTISLFRSCSQSILLKLNFVNCIHHGIIIVLTKVNLKMSLFCFQRSLKPPLKHLFLLLLASVSVFEEKTFHVETCFIVSLLTTLAANLISLAHFKISLSRIEQAHVTYFLALHNCFKNLWVVYTLKLNNATLLKLWNATVKV